LLIGALAQNGTYIFVCPISGRGGEHGVFVGLWRAAQQGGNKLTLIEGPAGVGKTRRVEEIIRYAEIDGATVLRGRCYEFGSAVPYQAIGEALQGTLGPNAGVYSGSCPLDSLDPVWLAELTRLLPALRQLRSELAYPEPAIGDTSRQRLFQAAAHFLLALGKCVLLIDDLQGADQATFDFPHYLVHQIAEAPVWPVGTYRLKEIGSGHPLTRLRQGLSRDHLVDHIELGSLSLQVVNDLVSSSMGEEGRAWDTISKARARGILSS